ncbi:aminotransferase class III-fold pyridoxal phosphate-dependent enzyme [Dokdonia sp. Hel_I_53]|uniref:aminotransferase class III-fold pyridoxal phosphate-dependent enzyme n=1 Tax=Dokdonia sp. Hel_I_53 TaxID=1566287 RepID=UPI00119905A2|nr:aminotransferase class III-fold pyridoxal phosphate-dependent enzyme [Dokdonia sp. Hel_I_53]TVZ52405.1 hydroxylysine kinase/5-phosphonooxy-L-lysine phospho-lyase apoenzyme [Dokdonia sp. Hel_I_53]
MSVNNHLDTAKEILLDYYNIKGKLTILPGEIDLNYKVHTPDEQIFILKISRTASTSNSLEFQIALLNHLKDFARDLNIPKAITTKDGKKLVKLKDEKNQVIFVRLYTWIEGRLWGEVLPKNTRIKQQLGSYGGKLTNALATFTHPCSQYISEWDIAQSLWTKKFTHILKRSKENRIIPIITRFEALQGSYKSLPKQIIHNDANDNNIIVSFDKLTPEVIALIDFGDSIYTQRINDLAIMCAYVSMEHIDPLRAILPIIRGYNEACKLSVEELAHLYITIQMRLVITVVKAAINHTKNPENSYLFVSEKAAWGNLKKWSLIDEEFALMRFRESVGLPPHPSRNEFNNWIKKKQLPLTALFPTVQRKNVYPLDLSVSSTWIGHEIDFNNLDWFQYNINQLQKKVPSKIIAGGYLEPRPLYTDDSFDTEADFGKQNRSVHLGVDFWLPAETPVHTIFDGEVVTSTFQKQHKNYGGLIILKHNEDNLIFYTLYGHLSKKSSAALTKGDLLSKGDCVGYLGSPEENGSWAPHLHFQVQLSLLNFIDDFPGVAFHHEIKSWKSLCPDPMILFGIDTLSRKRKKTTTNRKIIDYRKQHLGLGMSLHYDSPIQMVRGNGVYLLDQYGKKYLDTVNNVAHLGHEHPAVVIAGRDQMALLNTNTRYLHKDIMEFSQALLQTLPKEICVLHFVNSGSEANELALRMSRVVTGSKQVIASEMGYHGNTISTVAVSSYKFNGKGGSGKPSDTHLFPLPDTYRGVYRDACASQNYIEEVHKCIQAIESSGQKVGAFIIESLISCGGQIELPDGFLKGAFKTVRNAGGVCISDEVQTGVGRIGTHFWGFELHDVIPDIVTIGKPIGNGHPIAVVACTREVANAFSNGMEYFNTYGGNPVSCAIGKAVLDTIKQENLQQNALVVGSYLKSKLSKLAKDFPIIGDVRGQGLFLGFELVGTNLNPLPLQANYLINRMKDHSILMGVDGQDNNVIKIKPPLTFSIENATTLIFYLKKILQEDFMR